MLRKLFTLLLCFISFLNWSQNSDSLNKSVLSKGKIEQQFDYVIQKSNNFQEYKVVKKDYLFHLKKGTTDSISKYKSQINSLILEKEGHQKVVNDLENEKKSLENNISEIILERDQISFFGMPLAKGMYNSIVFTVIGVLLFLLIFSLLKMKNALINSREDKSSFEKLEIEFHEYKQKAMEKEQTLGRKLQDEINKQNKSKK